MAFSPSPDTYPRRRPAPRSSHPVDPPLHISSPVLECFPTSHSSPGLFPTIQSSSCPLEEGELIEESCLDPIPSKDREEILHGSDIQPPALSLGTARGKETGSLPESISNLHPVQKIPKQIFKQISFPPKDLASSRPLYSAVVRQDGFPPVARRLLIASPLNPWPTSSDFKSSEQR